MLWTLCMDDLTYALLSQSGLPNLQPISLKEFEKGDEPLLAAKNNRSLIEYYFTCTPSLILYILNSSPGIDAITYLDADLFFFGSLQSMYDEMGSDSIYIVEHRFPPHLSHLVQFGIYNVGLLCFKNDNSAKECLHWWRERCLEWCYDRVEDGRFADQKYLDEWPSRFPGVTVSKHKGVGLAPWNITNYALRLHSGHVTVDGEPLVYTHFHGFKKLNRWIYDPSLAVYRVKPSRFVGRNIYEPYIRELRSTKQKISVMVNQIGPKDYARYSQDAPQPMRYSSNSNRSLDIKAWLRVTRGLIRRDLMLFLGG